MTRPELWKELYQLVGDARKVERIFQLFGKLSPEPGYGNIFQVNGAKVPQYDEAKVRKVGRQKIHFTIEQQSMAREIMRKLGML